MIMILWQGGKGSHQDRALTLAHVTPGAIEGDIDKTGARALANLDTLIFWGHGDYNVLCGKSPEQIHTIIYKWKMLNDRLRTVEILTCNARHCHSGDSFVGKLKARMARARETGGIRIKALPISVAGKVHAWSILLTEVHTQSWVYVSAGGRTDTEAMFLGANLITSYVDKRDGKKKDFKGDIAERANQVLKDSANQDRKWSMTYGYFNTLRANLVFI